MNDNEKYQLQQMIEQNKVIDNTNVLRELKHSSEISKCVLKMLELKNSHHELLQTNKPKFEELVLKECSFLFFNYMQLYNTILKENLDMDIMNSLLTTLRKIENGECDQHEGSYEVGKLLKTIYIDGTLKDIQKHDEENKIIFKQPKTIQWSEYKKNM
uniref:Uncharacterized protein n=1 Tax=viral metagenome TaxID=1070528 RepID=A0A6C0B9G5_9ZZZZ